MEKKGTTNPLTIHEASKESSIIHDMAEALAGANLSNKDFIIPPTDYQLASELVDVSHRQTNKILSRTALGCTFLLSES